MRNVEVAALPGTVDPGWETTDIQAPDGMGDTVWLNSNGVSLAEWKEASKTLTQKLYASGTTIATINGANSISLPAGAALVVEPNAEWIVTAGGKTDIDATTGNGIYCAGDLTVIVEETVSLTLKGSDVTNIAGGDGLHARSELTITVESGRSLTAKGGNCVAGGKRSSA